MRWWSEGHILLALSGTWHGVLSGPRRAVIENGRFTLRVTRFEFFKFLYSALAASAAAVAARAVFKGAKP